MALKAVLKNLEGQALKELPLPEALLQPVREDLIKKAVLAIQSHKRQPYGAFEDAGQASAKLSRRRRDYKTAYGYGISRVPRKILSRRGSQFYWVGAFAPGTVGGRRAHPPKPEKKFAWKLNKKERIKALLSALSASFNPEVVKLRGHKLPEHYPLIVVDDFESIEKTSQALKVLKALGFEQELERASVKKIRAGKGKLRGRRYKVKKSLLVVLSKPCPVMKALQNIQGVDVCLLQNLNTELLAPGCHAGRIILLTESAFKDLTKPNGLIAKWLNSLTSVLKLKKLQRLVEIVSNQKQVKTVSVNNPDLKD